MLFAVLRQDRSGNEALRTGLKAEHDRYLKAFLPRIVYGGGLVKDGTDTSGEVEIGNVTGNVMIIEGSDQKEIEAFHRNDPYTQNDLFETVIIAPFWQRVPSLDEEA